MLNCKDITCLSSLAMDTTLPPLTRFRIRLHLLICRPCRVFHEQIQLIQKAIHGCCASAERGEAGAKELTLECKDRMKKRLEGEKLA